MLRTTLRESSPNLTSPQTLEPIYMFSFVAKVLLNQLCFIVSLVIARLKVIPANPIITVYVNHLLILGRKRRRNLIIANNICSKIMHQHNTFEDTLALILI